MKKCKKCGALQSDEKTTCLDCGTLLGRPMTEEEEEAADELLDDRLDDLSERMQDFYVPLRDKIMGVISIIGIIRFNRVNSTSRNLYFCLVGGRIFYIRIR